MLGTRAKNQNLKLFIWKPGRLYKIEGIGIGNGSYTITEQIWGEVPAPQAYEVDTVLSSGVAVPGTPLPVMSFAVSSPAPTPVDTTPPTIKGMPTPGTVLWPPNHKLVQMAVVSATDSETGVVFFDVTGSSNEPSDPKNPDIVITGTGVQSRVVSLRAERLGTGNGRIYTLNATATDGSGNKAIVTTTVTVPHDQGQ